MTAGPNEEQPLRVTATSSNTDLLAHPVVTYTSPQSTGTLTFTPAANTTGVSTITVSVEDGGNDGNLGTTGDNLITTGTFTVTVANLLAWHNEPLPTDVNNDGLVTPMDALLIINSLNHEGARKLPNSRPDSAPYYDANGDDWISPADAIAVINQLNRSPYDVAIRLNTTDVSGNAITTIESGRLFYLNLSTQDLRNSATGVYSVYADVYYDSQLIDVAGVSQFFDPYANGQSSLISEDGLIDEWGAFSGVETTGSSEIIVSRIPVRATGEGTVLFGLSGADDSPLHDVLLYDSAVPISHDQIQFHAVELNIVNAEGETAEGEGPIQLAELIQRLNTDSATDETTIDLITAPEPLLPVHSDDYYYQLETANQPQQNKSIQKQNDEIEDDLLDLLAKKNSD